ncbi:MAG: transposase [bacterium]
MSRPLRLEFEGAFYHIAARGNEQKVIFSDTADRKHFLELLERAHLKYGAIFHAYVLMDNHYHLILETPNPQLSKIVHLINTAYTVYFNLKYQRSGHLFQGRYHAIVIEQDQYLLALSRYLHLNPVRAKIVKNPKDYPWSSYAGYISKEPKKAWLWTDLVLSQVSNNKADAKKRYQEFVWQGIKEPVNNPFDQAYRGVILGSEKFVMKLIEGVDEQFEIPPSKRKKVSIALEDIYQAVLEEFPELALGGYQNLGKAVAIYLSKKYLNLSNSEIGEYFGGLGYSGICQAARRMERRRREDKGLARKIKRVEDKLSIVKT